MASEAYQRFKQSMKIGFDQWHDGTGYDLEALKEMPEAERQEIETMLRTRRADDWRVVEALAFLGTPAALDAVRGNIHATDPIVRLEAIHELHRRGEIDDLTPPLAEIMDEHGSDFPIFSRTLDMIGWYKVKGTTPQLLRQCVSGHSIQAGNAAAMIYYLHDLSDSTFDWAHRPFFLRFNGGREAVEAAFRELCSKIDVDPIPYLKTRP